MTAAADELVVTQPSISSALAALGRELGLRAVRARRPGHPADGGRHGVRAVRRRCTRSASEGPRGRAGSVVGGGAPARDRGGHDRGRIVRPRDDARIRAEHPDIELTLVVGNRAGRARTRVEPLAPTSPSRASRRRRTAGRRAVHGERDRVHHRARRSGGRRRARRAWPAVGSALAPAGARLGNARAQRAVPGRARPRAEDADARLERRDQAGRARRARDFAPVAGRPSRPSSSPDGCASFA